MAPLVKKRNQNGFTLLELLVAISLLAIGLLATATMQVIAINATSYANRISVATRVGQQVAEEIISLQSTDPLLNTAVAKVTYNRMFNPATNTSNASTVLISGAGTFKAEYDITPNIPIAGTPFNGTTQITVRVYYGLSATPVTTFSTYKMVK